MPCTANGSRPSRRTAALAGAGDRRAAPRPRAAQRARSPPASGARAAPSDERVVRRSGRPATARQRPGSIGAQPAAAARCPAARDAARSASDGSRASNSASSSRPVPAAVRRRSPAAAPAEPAGGGGDARRPGRSSQPAAAERLDVVEVAHQPGVDRRLHAARVRVPAGRRARVEQQQQQRVHAVGIRTGSSAGPSAARSTGCGSISSPSMRTANVSLSTSMRGSASFSGRSALRQPRHVARSRPAGGRTAQRSASPASSAAGETNVRPSRAGSDAERAEHRPRQLRLRRRDRGVRVAHVRPGDHAGLEHHVRADAEERRLPQHQVGQLARLDRADLVGQAVRDGRRDRVLGDVAAGAMVVGRAVAGAARRGAASSRARSARCG